jgi:hypothetical protein
MVRFILSSENLYANDEGEWSVFHRRIRRRTSMRLVAPGAYGLFPAVRCESRAALAMLLAFPLQRRVIHVPQKSTMTEDALHWSCYTTPPARSLEIF